MIELTSREAAAVYLWAVRDRNVPEDPDELRLVGAGLQKLIVIAGDAIRWEPVELDGEESSPIALNQATRGW